MADLDFLAAGSTASDAPVKRDVKRERKANPFEGKLTESWDACEWDPKRKDGKGAYVGQTFELTTYSAEDTGKVVRALRLAAENVGVGLAVTAPSEREDTGEVDAKGKPKFKTRYLPGLIRYSAMERRERKSKDEGEPAAEQGEGKQDNAEQDDEREPANV